MKLWEKIFISSLIVLETFFISSSIFLIHRSFTSSLDSEVTSGIDEENRVCASATAYVYEIKMHGQEEYVDNTDSILTSYITYIKGENISISLKNQAGKEIFNNLNKDMNSVNKAINISNISNNKEGYIIREEKDKEYLFVYKNIEISDGNYNVAYVKDISYIYKNKNLMFNLLIKINISISIALAVVMIIMSKIIVKPINKLIDTTKEISEGHFNERVKLGSKDELGILAENFNNMAEVIEEKIGALKRLSDYKQNFIDNLSHELRTPLTSIIGYSDFLIKNRCDEKTTKEALHYIYNEGKRMEMLSTKLMQLINLEDEKINTTKIDVKKLLQNIKNAALPKFKEKGIGLEILTEEFQILGDEDLIIILINNLLDNASKASKEGDTIYVKAYSNENLVIEVIDNGMGMEEEELEKIFEPFYMIDKSRSRKNNGAGLGLTLCSIIAKVHNAKIEIESKVSIGTTVRIKF